MKKIIAEDGESAVLNLDWFRGRTGRPTPLASTFGITTFVVVDQVEFGQLDLFL